MLTLKEVLAKEVADLTAEEKGFLNEKIDELSAEDKVKFAEVLGEGLDLKAVKDLVRGEIDAALAGKAEKISSDLVSKFFAGVGDARKKAIEAGGTPEKKVVKGDKTRQWLKAVVAGDKDRAKALSTSTSGESPDDAQAGLLIPEELMTEVLRIAETQYGLARRDMFYLPFSGPGNSRKIPALGTSVNVFWTDEMESKKSTQPKFSIVEQTLKKLAAICPFSEEILEDSAIDIEGLLAKLFAEAVSKEEDLQFFAGTGSPWTGVLNNGDVNQVNQVLGVVGLTADDLLDMQDATPSGALNGAKYYLHRTVLSVVRKLKDDQGNYIFQNPGGGLPGTIWNFPYELSDAFPAVSEIEDGDPYILFGNLKQGCIFGDKQQLRVKLLDQATIEDTDSPGTSLNLAQRDMLALRIVERVGYVVALPKALTVLVAGTDES